MAWGWGWRPYVSAAERRSNARQFAAKLAKSGKTLHPINLSGRAIAKTFWGKAWCDNLESYSDYANRLPRGRTYVRNGSVIDLQIEAGEVTAIVSGSDLYHVKIQIDRLGAKLWKSIKQDCSQSIDSLIDLLQGRLSDGVMQRLTRQKDGLFPQPKEIHIRCSCPDWAVLCKHAAAVLYGVGSRLDEEPELLFSLRAVNHLELITQAVAGSNLDQALAGDSGQTLGGEDLGAMFGIELDTRGDAAPPATRRGRRTRSPAGATAKKPAKSPKSRGARAKANAGKASAVNVAARSKAPQAATDGKAPQAKKATPRKSRAAK